MMKIVRKNLIVFVVTGIMVSSVLMAGCQEKTSDDGAMDVLVTIIPQVEMVEAIGGDCVDVTVMVPVGENPHHYELLPSQMIEVANAKAYFTLGSEMEFEINHVDTIIEQNPDIEIVDTHIGVQLKALDEHYGQEHWGNHSGGDAHMWLSPVNMKIMAENVYNALIEIDSDHKSEYESNYQNYSNRLNDLDVNITSMLEPYSGKSFMVYHPGWGYFGDTYNLKQIAIEEGGKQPGSAGVAAIIDQAKEENITVIFVAPQFDTSSAEVIAQEIGGLVVFANPLSGDYETTLFNIAADIVSGFEGS